VDYARVDFRDRGLDYRVAGFSYYVSRFGPYNKVYGSIVTFIVLMTWMYLMGFVILVGGNSTRKLNMPLSSAKIRVTKTCRIPRPSHREKASMSLINLSLKHQKRLEIAKNQLEKAVHDIQSQFQRLVRQVEWSDDHSWVRFSAFH
jgi:hypothetical protein